MKKTYEKPTLNKRQQLSRVTAVFAGSAPQPT
ncbi:putative RiPP precursor [Mesorhizobium loti]